MVTSVNLTCQRLRKPETKREKKKREGEKENTNSAIINIYYIYLMVISMTFMFNVHLLFSCMGKKIQFHFLRNQFN